MTFSNLDKTAKMFKFTADVHFMVYIPKYSLFILCVSQKAYKSRLQALNETLKQSAFFSKHEVSTHFTFYYATLFQFDFFLVSPLSLNIFSQIIGSSLLFVYDSNSKANIWMIDFGKTIQTPDNVHLRHDVPWVEGNREDGYLIGLISLISLLGEAIRQAEEDKEPSL